MPKTRSGPSGIMLRSYALQTEVDRLIHSKKYELAVLVAQTLLELRTEAELVHYVRESHQDSLGEGALCLLPNYNLGNQRVQGFVERILGFRFKDECNELFRAVQTHNALRNRIAHDGATCDESDARASRTAVVAMTDFLHERFYRMLGMEADLEEEARQRIEVEDTDGA